MLHRRALFRGFGSLLAMPAIVRADALMRISVPRPAGIWLVAWNEATIFGEAMPSLTRYFVPCSDLVLPEEIPVFAKSWTTAKAIRA
jgi:hypothetical protein